MNITVKYNNLTLIGNGIIYKRIKVLERIKNEKKT